MLSRIFLSLLLALPLVANACPYHSQTVISVDADLNKAFADLIRQHRPLLCIDETLHTSTSEALLQQLATGERNERIDWLVANQTMMDKATAQNLILPATRKTFILETTSRKRIPVVIAATRRSINPKSPYPADFARYVHSAKAWQILQQHGLRIAK